MKPPRVIISDGSRSFSWGQPSGIARPDDGCLVSPPYPCCCPQYSRVTGPCRFWSPSLLHPVLPVSLVLIHQPPEGGGGGRPLKGSQLAGWKVQSGLGWREVGFLIRWEGREFIMIDHRLGGSSPKCMALYAP